VSLASDFDRLLLEQCGTSCMPGSIQIVNQPRRASASWPLGRLGPQINDEFSRSPHRDRTDIWRLDRSRSWLFRIADGGPRISIAVGIRGIAAKPT